MEKLTALFLSQSYQDAWDDYQRALYNDVFPVWDYVILTASNELQAQGFRMQLNERKNFLPSRTHYAVIPDEGGERVGSGGATLSVIRYIRQKEASFEGLRILVIHSGGDSKRVPQYSALGKLFSPVPHELPNGKRSTLFDEIMVSMASVPSRIKNGMLLMSGDVLLLFNPLQIDYSGANAAALSFKENAEIGKNHGVFLQGNDGNVSQFLHKQTIESLSAKGAINSHNCVDIDTGAIIFSPAILEALFSLISSREDYIRYVNSKVRLSLYGDFLFPLASDSTLDRFYLEKPEGYFCQELYDARAAVWNVLRPFRMKLLRLAPAKFIHFGTTQEIMSLMNEGIYAYNELGWSNNVGSSLACGVSGYNSVLSDNATVGENCYLETSYVHSNGKIGNNVLLSYIDVHDEVIPDDVVLHGLKQRDGKFVVRIYGIQDNPKEGLLFGKSLDLLNNIWDETEHTLWTANLYPVCDSIQEAVAAALNLYAIVHGKGDINKWESSTRKSLCSGFRDADIDAIVAWDHRMEDLVRMDEIAKLISSGRPAIEGKKVLLTNQLTKIQQEWLETKLNRSDFSTAMRLYYYIGVALGNEMYITKCFKIIQNKVLETTIGDLKYDETTKILMPSHTVRLPLRVNWGGGWSDTPPYCLEKGGTVLNAAIVLNDEYPVEVTLEKIDERKIVFDSRDMDVHGEFDTIEPLQATGDPYDPFALQKACLLACGIIPQSGGDLKKILDRLGGGFVMHSEVTNVPKGSGLGTSSILSAACVKCMLEFMGIKHDEEDLYDHVLAMEQIMSTGGGWQDQVGGITGGIKYITSRPGLKQKLKVQHLDLSQETMKELNRRFCLIYTGQRRLARNLLRDVVGRYVGNESVSVSALNEIQCVATLMRFELERGNINEFAKLLERHWILSQKIDASSTNTLINQIFSAIEDMIDGRMVCGAGGGGFLQVILKQGVSKQDVHFRLKEVFQDNPVDVWSCRFV